MAGGSDKNFGFSIRGGREHGSPIIVEHVTRGKGRGVRVADRGSLFG